MTAVHGGRQARVRVASLEEVAREGVKVVAVEGRSIALFYDQGAVYALDNRCPHMGFPLHRGTVKNGILTCHWHHAKFDLAGGCTFDPFADDVPSFHVEVRDGQVWLDPRPQEEEREAHWLAKLEEGLEQEIPLVLAKSVIGLDASAAEEVVRRAALFGVRNRAAGWSSGLSILTAMANVRPALDPADRPLALFHGVVHVARSTAGQPPSFDLAPLRTRETRPERYLEWFRRAVEVRSAPAAERALRTAIAIGLPREAVATMLIAACTDHLYLDEGHALDFANKALELLDVIGWEHAQEVLPSLVPGLVEARRMEESSSWRDPVDLADLLAQAHRELDAAIAQGQGRQRRAWDGHVALAEQVMDGDPAETLERMLELVRQGTPLTELSAAVAYAAVRRAVHFRTTNEFGDWDTIHHSFTYANAVDQALRRAPSTLAARGIFDAAMSVYLERFLNVPKQPAPRPSGRIPRPEEVLAAFDAQGQVDETAHLVADLLAARQHDQVVRLLGHALLREDAGFHQFQMYEAGLRQYRRFAGTPAGDHVLIGVARFLTAHAPTVRARGQTYDIAARLLRGEALHGEDT